MELGKLPRNLENFQCTINHYTDQYSQLVWQRMYTNLSNHNATY